MKEKVFESDTLISRKKQPEATKAPPETAVGQHYFTFYRKPQGWVVEELIVSGDKILQRITSQENMKTEAWDAFRKAVVLKLWDTPENAR